MIIFHNPGEIEANAFRLMGASVKASGSFGRFGTGLKYAIATILRNEGMITVHSGRSTFRFELETTVLKEQCFSEVVLVEDGGDFADIRMPLGFTVELGKDWEPWMAIRELGCNARDEGGDFLLWADPNWGPSGDGTEIVVNWPKVEETWADVLAQTFVSGDLLHEEAGVRVHAGQSAYLYHRGVRVWKLPKPSLFTYDITAPVELTEDRTVKYGFCVVANVRNMLLKTEERGIIAAAVTAKEDTWEATFDWTGTQWIPRDPGVTWLEEVSILREKKQPISKSAKDVLLAHSAYQTKTYYGGGSYDEPTGTFGDAAAALEDLGVDLKEVKTFVAEELPGGAATTIKNGNVLVSKALLEDGSRLTLASEMLRRWLELKSGGDHDALLNLVVPLLLDQSYELKQEREVTEAREAGLRPTPLEVFVGVHPVLPKPDLVDGPDF